MDKTYAETRGEAPFDWNRFLDRAEREGVEYEEGRKAARLALEWTTCACGNQCAIIPRQVGGSPYDTLLVDLGAKFAGSIEVGDWRTAKSLLKRIEQRSAVLIAEELQKLSSPCPVN